MRNKRETTKKMKGVPQEPTKIKRESARQLAFAKYYLSEQIDGKPNPTYLKAGKAAMRAGFAPGYARNILHRIAKQNSAVGKKVDESRKKLSAVLQEKGIDSEWVAGLILKMSQSRKRGLYRGKFLDSGDPDSFAVKAALDFVAKTQGLYYADETHPNDPDNLDGRSKEELVEILARGLVAKSKSAAGLGKER